jgi:hypothetical protein
MSTTAPLLPLATDQQRRRIVKRGGEIGHPRSLQRPLVGPGTMRLGFSSAGTGHPAARARLRNRPSRHGHGADLVGAGADCYPFGNSRPAAFAAPLGGRGRQFTGQHSPAQLRRKPLGWWAAGSLLLVPG